MASQQLPVVLYHYPYSPYARRVLWYLHLRGIPFTQCVQPPIMPRQDLLRLSITHRRIPILSIGRDIYLDSRLILQKLEQAFPPSETYPALPVPSSSSPESALLEPLLRSSAIDNGIFASGAKLIPTTLPLTKDPKFQKDRADFFGPGPGSKEAAAGQVAEALADIKAHFELLESIIFSDNRCWVLGTPEEQGPSMADIEAVWVLHWLTTLPGALGPKGYISAEKFPRVFGWIARFDKTVKASSKKHKGVQSLVVKGDEAERIIRSAGFNEEDWDKKGVDTTEPIVTALGLERGGLVEAWPTDTGVGHRDLGVLVGLDGKEVVIEKVETKGWSGGNVESDGKGNVRVHLPRHGFRVRAVKAGGESSNL
ncbi:hypothetical protein V8F06_011955 [Rhypophila decipiens]